MNLLNKALLYFLIFLIALLHLNPIKNGQISNESEKNCILRENQNKTENSFQKIFQEKSLKKDKVFKRKEDRNFIEVSKEAEKKEKPMIKDERDENNPRKLTDEDNSKIHIDIYFLYEVRYDAGFNVETDNHRDTVVFLKSGSDTIQLGDSFNINSNDKLEIYFSSDVTTLESFF